MEQDKLFYIGYISKTHGVKGDLILKADVDDINDYKKLTSVFLKKDEQTQSFELSKSALKDAKSLIIHLKTLETIEAVENLVGSEAYGPITFLKPLKGNRFYFHEVINFEVIDEVHGNIGKIKGVMEMPTQSLLQVIHPSKKEILIPIVDEIIKKVDREQKQILIDTPEGLIEIYL